MTRVSIGGRCSFCSFAVLEGMLEVSAPLEACGFLCV